VSGAITESTNDCVNAVCKSVQYHIRALRHIRPSISEDVAKMVSSVLADYTKSFLFGTTPKSISKLQKAQNYLARVSPVPLDPAVHTAPVAPHLSACQPASLLSALHACHSTRSLRVSNTNLLRDPFVRSLFGVRNFSFIQPLKSGTLFL